VTLTMSSGSRGSASDGEQLIKQGGVSGFSAVGGGEGSVPVEINNDVALGAESLFRPQLFPKEFAEPLRKWEFTTESGGGRLSGNGAEHSTSPRRIATAANRTDDLVWVTERWHGVVEEIYDDAFSCRLAIDDDPLTAIVGEIPLTKVYEDDLELLSVGASFYLTIGTIPFNRRRVQTSMLRFRRLPRWRADHLDEIRERARKRRASLVDE
jgi:hypothetical protein